MTTWYSAAEGDAEAQTRLANAWPDAPLVNLETCQMILEVAQEQVIAYAPEGTPAQQIAAVLTRLGFTSNIAAVLALLDVDDDTHVDPPTRYVYAQLKQAENLWNAGRSDSDGMVGAEGYSFQPRPLDKTIREIIRPRDGKPDVH